MIESQPGRTEPARHLGRAFRCLPQSHDNGPASLVRVRGPFSGPMPNRDASGFWNGHERSARTRRTTDPGQVGETGLRLQKEIEEGEVCLTQAIHHQTLGVVGSVGTVAGMIRLLEWFLAHPPSP
ncbi:hypothetical protein MCA1921 [Methylococcus capsulatus str. Bath]|uniref:Uncharacterized protein n=2 Tax=Methylococcus capsulatus TaxID=414 RepID=Q606U3_METCA|nr:hypothetical protein MCA1921 [Methylococcus capsulatus str. Bath]